MTSHQAPAPAAPPLPRPRIVAVDGVAGAGKTTVVQGLLARGGQAGRARSAVLSPHMDDILRELVDQPTQGILGYQHVMPPDFVRMSRLVDGVMQFRYRAAELAAVDWLFVDGWISALDVYCPDSSPDEPWLRRFSAWIPEPELLCYLRVSPEVGCERLVRQGHWTARNWGTGRLLSELRLACARYDEVMAGRDCLVVDADGPLEQIVTEVLGHVSGDGSRAEAAR